MNEFVQRMEMEIPLFRSHLDSGLSAIVRTVPFYLELNQDRTGLRGRLDDLLSAMDEMLNGMEGLNNSVHGLPRVSSSFARSRRATERVVQDVIDIAVNGKTSLERALSLLN